MLLVFPAIDPGLIVQLPAGKPVKTMLPVETEQEGCVNVPTVGAAGVTGCELITTADVAADVQPAAFDTVKLYDPDDRPVMVLLAPEPAIAPGLIVQLPVGKPLNTTLPVATVQVG